jgi:hypothetical protein
VPGIRTDGNGVVRVAPTTSQDAGNNATLARFVQLYPRLTLTSSSVGLPRGRLDRNGQTCPAGSPDAGRRATVQIKVWASFSGPASQHPQSFSDPAAIKFANQQLITVAFVPAGATVPKPSPQTILALLQARSGSANPTTNVTIPPSATTTTPTTPAPTTPTTKAK